MVEAQVRSGMRQVLSVGVLALGVVAVLTSTASAQSSDPSVTFLSLIHI